MLRWAIFLAGVLAAVGCATGTGLDDDDDDDATDAEGSDPLRFFEQTSQEEITATIEDLVGFGTRYTFTDGDDEARDYLVERFAEVGLIAELDPFVVSGEDCANVIAKKQGTGATGVVWIYSAHYDSTSTDAELYAPGADDNASGVAAVLEAARLLAGHEFRDSIWFVMTAAEEQGSRGSEHLVQWLGDESVDVAGVIAPDMIGYWPLGEDDLMDILGDGESEHLVEGMAAVADALGVAHKDYINHAYCYGDDHTNFQEAGIPAITPMDCVEAHNLPGSGEHTPHYHQVSDTIDTLDLPFLTKASGVITSTLAEWAGEQD